MAEIREELGREAVDAVATAVLDTVKRTSTPIPDSNAIEQWSREVVRDVVRRNEDPEPEPEREFEASPSALDKGDIPEDAEVIGGALDPDREGGLTPQARRHLFGARPDPEADMLKAIMSVMLRLPEWRAKLDRASLEGDTAAKNSGAIDDAINWNRRSDIIMAHMLKVIESPAAMQMFGYWRDPVDVAKKCAALAKILTQASEAPCP